MPEKGEFGKKNVYKEQHRDMLACRYYYHTTICRLRYDDCLVQLSREFGVAPTTVELHLKSRLSAINVMVEERTTAQELKKRYPWYNWDGKPFTATV